MSAMRVFCDSEVYAFTLLVPEPLAEKNLSKKMNKHQEAAAGALKDGNR
jgi:hypothetical protein